MDYNLEETLSSILDHEKDKPDVSGDNSWEVEAYQKISYKVMLAYDLLNIRNSKLANVCGFSENQPLKRLIVIDELVYDLYQEKLYTYFHAWNITPTWKIIASGEIEKIMVQAINVADAMNDFGLLRRSEAIIAIGGGVLLDIVGFAASLYRRGVPYVRIPTTLMGQIDAGIGIKTGINHGYHKNRLGTYFPPVAVLVDPGFLKTLDHRHIVNGIAEILKIAFIKDADLFNLFEKELSLLNAPAFSTSHIKINEIFSRSISGMLEELEPNLWEAVLERAVDYGHTFSPSLELKATPPILHGEAVAIDMVFSLILAMNHGLIKQEEVTRALNLMTKTGLPLSHQDFTLEMAIKALDDSTKHRDGLQRVPLTMGIGNVTFVNDLTIDELKNAMAYISKISLTINFATYDLTKC